jgi:hypothetical protein
MSNRKVILEFDVADLPMLAAALRTTACEALMCGRPGARERIDAYRSAIEKMIPEPARIFDGLTWSEICLALNGATSYSVRFEEWGYHSESRSKYGMIYVSIGNKRYGSHDFRNLRDTLDTVQELVAAMAPLDCTHVPVEDSKARHLMPVPRPQRTEPDDEPARTWNP